MEEWMSEEEQDGKVIEWLERTIQPQDSVSVHGQELETDHGEPMLCANHGASDQPACERMWKQAQWQSNRDGRPRIPLQPNVREAPDMESQAALRRGVVADQHQQNRTQRRHQEWERNRSRTWLTNRSKVSDRWEEVP